MSGITPSLQHPPFNEQNTPPHVGDIWNIDEWESYLTNDLVQDSGLSRQIPIDLSTLSNQPPPPTFDPAFEFLEPLYSLLSSSDIPSQTDLPSAEPGYCESDILAMLEGCMDAIGHDAHSNISTTYLPPSTAQQATSSFTDNTSSMFTFGANTQPAHQASLANARSPAQHMPPLGSVPFDSAQILPRALPYTRRAPGTGSQVAAPTYSQSGIVTGALQDGLTQSTSTATYWQTPSLPPQHAPHPFYLEDSTAALRPSTPAPSTTCNPSNTMLTPQGMYQAAPDHPQPASLRYITKRLSPQSYSAVVPQQAYDTFERVPQTQASSQYIYNAGTSTQIGTPSATQHTLLPQYSSQTYNTIQTRVYPGSAPAVSVSHPALVSPGASSSAMPFYEAVNQFPTPPDPSVEPPLRDWAELQNVIETVKDLLGPSKENPADFDQSVDLVCLLEAVENGTMELRLSPLRRYNKRTFVAVMVYKGWMARDVNAMKTSVSSMVQFIIEQMYPNEDRRPAELQRSIDYYDATDGAEWYPKSTWRKEDGPPRKKSRNE